MAVRKLEKSEWRPFFDTLSKSLVGKRAEIEVASLDLGDQIEAEFLPLLGIVFDNKDDTIEVALDGVDHLISNRARSARSMSTSPRPVSPTSRSSIATTGDTSCSCATR
ncbi:MAG: uncharacterized protein JWL84_2407 [Rhodospirillales bacterium]|nr:uncharacterized protein [Rhodospirillales bacterium]